ncbi:MAG: hypothetical protein WC470_03370 [Candidatus Paceibacterota bacterium]
MEEETNPNEEVVVKKSQNWLWILGTIVAIGVLVYFILSGFGMFKAPAPATNTNNNQSEQPVVNNTPTVTDENIDNLLNQLDVEESQANTALNDTPIDVLSDN